MSVLRIGTRGSKLARWQTNWVSQRLSELHPGLRIEQVTIRTHGDVVTDQNFGRDWPVGAFVSALESALLEGRFDLAVHSHKDLQTAETAGLVIAAVPVREVVHDVLLTRGPTALEELPPGARIGTNSPRRAAQLLLFGDFEIVPIRGNVPTRVAKLERENLDAVVLAAAGLKRLGISHPHTIELPTDRFLPAPAQGALAVQARAEDAAAELAAGLDHLPTRRCVIAERSFLARINAGCHTPVGALAVASGDQLSLHARLFSDDYARVVEDRETGEEPVDVGMALADRLVEALKDQA
jgi:hydroxymethylbilane synthase